MSEIQKNIKQSALNVRITFFSMFSVFISLSNFHFQIERRKLLHIFLMKFIQMYENWEPEKDFPLEIYAHEHSNEFPEDIIGCSDGHPSEVILILIQELNGLTSVVAEGKLKLL